jgi:hypothetical protein
MSLHVPVVKVNHVIDVLKRCARCGGKHKDITFFQLDRPADEYTHYALCPSNLQPILLAFTK